MKDALAARHVLWQLEADVEVHGPAVVDHEAGRARGIVGHFERVLGHAFVCGGDAGIVDGAKPELEVSPVVGCQLDHRVHHLSSLVASNNDALGVLATGLVVARVRLTPGVATNAALATVTLPLNRVAAAEQLVVVVVLLRLEPHPPHRRPGRRFHEPSVGLAGLAAPG